MGANVEVDMFLKKGDVSFKQLFSLLENEGLSVRIKKMRIFDDWNYTHETNIDLHALDLMGSHLGHIRSIIFWDKRKPITVTFQRRGGRR